MSGGDAEIDALVVRVGQLLTAREARIATAESCTGGLLAKSLTDMPGSSKWFEFGFVTYGDNAKETMLALDPDLIARRGVLSREVAEAMALSAHAVSGADIAVAVTGVAGPAGGTEDKPVGTVWLAWLGPRKRATCRIEQFDGDRAEIRHKAVVAALQGVLRHLADA